jgi:hypothetical protein
MRVHLTFNKAKEFGNLFGPGQSDVFHRLGETLRQSTANAQSSLHDSDSQASRPIVNLPTTSSTIPSVQTTPAPLPTATSAVNNIIHQQTNIQDVNTSTTNSANKCTDIISQGNRMFTYRQLSAQDYAFGAKSGDSFQKMLRAFEQKLKHVKSNDD